jgi:DNA-binding NarL/FixJ family response regulator
MDPSMPSPTDDVIRVLLVARHPLRSVDLGLDSAPGITAVGLVRRPDRVADAIVETRPHLVVVDTGLPGGAATSIIEQIRTDDPTIHVLALTPDPPPVQEVARAVRAGAGGFIDIDLEPGEAVDAIKTLCADGTWFKPEHVTDVLREVADDLDVTSTDRRSRLTTVVLGLIPLAGVLAGLLSLLWRRYLGQIGVRPVDLGIDPGSRVVDVVFSLLTFIGFFGPFLFIGTWTEEIQAQAERRSADGGLLRRRRLVQGALAVGVLGIGAFLLMFADLVLVLFIGPAVSIALIGAILDLQSELPRVLRLRPIDIRRFAISGVVVAFALLFVLGGEALLRGPGFDRRGVNGLLMHRVIGFRAQPVLHTDVGGDGSTREVLYLGGNADLYVFVDPCNDGAVYFVSVGSSRLENIDEVTCSDP